MGHPFWNCSHANSLNFGVPMEPEANELPKCLVLDRDGNIHIRHIGSTPMGDVGCYIYTCLTIICSISYICLTIIVEKATGRTVMAREGDGKDDDAERRGEREGRVREIGEQNRLII
ncbi:unnamed protein product [Malus baccata var. baccata]